ncbi:UDP-N-acetylglucosamine 2-epimerase (non-hydrolyzing) [Candidatus Micrarchaeota archaeon]|nr:UDP-N-acetylglucosamine 2-epimerase (non-hydrolyzing) [Candidatus Micrarchaeota archaeon]
MFAIILGTRPELIKLSPVIRELQRQQQPFFILHTNQHYSYEMDQLFFEQLKLPTPKYNLCAGGKEPAVQLALMLEKIGAILVAEKPDCVMVQGDTNTVLAGALAASKSGIVLAHIEAGLRSFDRRMAEEYNRVVTDHISDVLFVPTEDAAGHLREEGIGSHDVITSRGTQKAKIVVCGNTSLDATLQNIPFAKIPSALLGAKQDVPEKFVLLTVHRAENVDDPVFLKALAVALKTIPAHLPILAPLHPRTVKNLRAFGLSLPVTVLPPQGYLEFLALEKAAEFIITDSGGVQEEACTLGVPCVTVRKSTDRPETVTVGANILAGTTASGMTAAFAQAQKLARGWKNPYGDGHAAQIIVQTLINSTPNQEAKNGV